MKSNLILVLFDTLAKSFTYGILPVEALRPLNVKQFNNICESIAIAFIGPPILAQILRIPEKYAVDLLGFIPTPAGMQNKNMVLFELSKEFSYSTTNNREVLSINGQVIKYGERFDASKYFSFGSDFGGAIKKSKEEDFFGSLEDFEESIKKSRRESTWKETSKPTREETQREKEFVECYSPKFVMSLVEAKVDDSPGGLAQRSIGIARELYRSIQEQYVK